MGQRLRRMKPYHPRKRTKRVNLHRQTLRHLKHKISADVGGLIVLIREGNFMQVTHAQQKARSDFLKYAEEMRKIAQIMGTRFDRAVKDYLDSIDAIIHANATLLDDATIQNCHQMSERLERELKAA